MGKFPMKNFADDKPVVVELGESQLKFAKYFVCKVLKVSVGGLKSYSIVILQVIVKSTKN